MSGNRNRLWAGGRIGYEWRQRSLLDTLNVPLSVQFPLVNAIATDSIYGNRRGAMLMTQCTDCVVCRCESITLSEIRRAVENGAASPQEVKMLTRAGKGICGGRVCGILVGRIIAAETGIDMEKLLWTRSRPPVRPTLLSEIADPSVDAVFNKSEAHVDTLSSSQHHTE